MQMVPFVTAAAAVALIAVPAAAAEMRDHPKAVVELFTSQGCSSCPSADAKLTELQKDPDLITLAYHVDYWDYIGWTDTFGGQAQHRLAEGLCPELGLLDDLYARARGERQQGRRRLARQ